MVSATSHPKSARHHASTKTPGFA